MKRLKKLWEVHQVFPKGDLKGHTQTGLRRAYSNDTPDNHLKGNIEPGKKAKYLEKV